MSASLSQEMKAGNLGDVFKHACLLELFSSISSDPHSQLTYIESHSGYASYPLSTLKNHDGEWSGERKWGIGLVLEEEWSAMGLKLLVDYVKQSQTYPGSPMLAMRSLPGIASLVFHDLKESAAASVKEAGEHAAREGNITVMVTDGFQGVREHLAAPRQKQGRTLAFLDPWYVGNGESADWHAVLDILRMVVKVGASAVAWYPKKLREREFPTEYNIQQVRRMGVGMAEVWFEDARGIPPWASWDLAGCGLLWVNVPTLDNIAQSIGEDLKRVYAGRHTSNGRRLDLEFNGS